MKTGKTFDQLVRELDYQNKDKKDYLVNTQSLIMDADEYGASLTMVNDATNTSTILGINDVAHYQIAQSLGIPTKYYEKMQRENPALLAENVNAWFQNDPKDRMIRTLNGNVRAVLSKQYRRIDNAPLFETVYPILADIPELQFASSEITDSKMYIKIVNQRLTREVRPGDYVQSGLIISNSEVGMGTVTIQPLLYRLVCTNGMVVNDFKSATRRRHIGKGNMAAEDYTLYASDTLLADDQALMLKIRDTIHAALNEVHFTNLIDNMKAATEVKIETNHIPEMVELAAPQFGFTKKEGEGILDHLIRGGDLTMYGFANAVTRFAQDVESYDRSTELEEIGYDILTMPARTWKILQTAEAA